MTFEVCSHRVQDVLERWAHVEDDTCEVQNEVQKLRIEFQQMILLRKAALMDARRNMLVELRDDG